MSDLLPPEKVEAGDSGNSSILINANSDRLAASPASSGVEKDVDSVSVVFVDEPANPLVVRPVSAPQIFIAILFIPRDRGLTPLQLFGMEKIIFSKFLRRR